jgi:hypothetical protein
VTRESVERILHGPKLAEQRATEEDVSAFDPGDEPVPPTRWTGWKPWEELARRTEDAKS